MSEQNTFSGMAALSICEALLLALETARVLPDTKIIGVLGDAAATHEDASGPGISVHEHRAAATHIKTMIAGGNSARAT